MLVYCFPHLQGYSQDQLCPLLQIGGVVCGGAMLGGTVGGALLPAVCSGLAMHVPLTTIELDLSHLAELSPRALISTEDRQIDPRLNPSASRPAVITTSSTWNRGWNGFWEMRQRESGW